MSPLAWASAAQRSASVVLPLEGPPRTTTLASAGSPEGPRMASSAGKPVEMTPAAGRLGSWLRCPRVGVRERREGESAMDGRSPTARCCCRPDRAAVAQPDSSTAPAGLEGGKGTVGEALMTVPWPDESSNICSISSSVTSLSPKPARLRR